MLVLLSSVRVFVCARLLCLMGLFGAVMGCLVCVCLRVLCRD